MSNCCSVSVRSPALAIISPSPNQRPTPLARPPPEHRRNPLCASRRLEVNGAVTRDEMKFPELLRTLNSKPAIELFGQTNFVM